MGPCYLNWTRASSRSRRFSRVDIFPNDQGHLSSRDDLADYHVNIITISCVR